ncbi:RlmE family RNA methyltransferase [Rhodospirillaceae bacterium AH-315-P19]|nr:RlmE family RNA methyltransferase [Rhodospirillaceae bacterium AH-315-P19]
MAAKGKSGSGGRRQLTTRVRTARGRRASSTRWLQRQLNDPYVAEAQHRGLRSRAAFKLMELDDRFRFLGPGKRVVDLGAAPGGWTKVAVARVQGKTKGCVVAIDCLAMDAVSGAHILQLDFLDASAPARICEGLDGPADVVLSDMAAPASGHASTDHLRIIALCEAALDFAEEILAPGGTFLAKVLKGGAEKELLLRMKKSFRIVKHAKPPASRPGSAESYVIAMGFKGSGFKGGRFKGAASKPSQDGPEAHGWEPG